jgi:hypothetical protein
VVYGVQKYKAGHANATTTEAPDASTAKGGKGRGHSSSDDDADVKPWGGRHIPVHRSGAHHRSDDD